MERPISRRCIHIALSNSAPPNQTAREPTCEPKRKKKKIKKKLKIFVEYKRRRRRRQPTKRALWIMHELTRVRSGIFCSASLFCTLWPGKQSDWSDLATEDLNRRKSIELCCCCYFWCSLWSHTYLSLFTDGRWWRWPWCSVTRANTQTTSNWKWNNQ